MGRRKHKHEDHANHEAWAIPYGDLITLLLAFFVVMYAISSVNVGKYRVLSDSLTAAFRGNPKTLEPVQMGEKSQGSGADISVSIVQQAMLQGQPRQMLETLHKDGDRARGAAPKAGSNAMTEQLSRVADELEAALKDLVESDLVAVRRHEFWLEVEVRTDILFQSGVANLSDTAYPALDALAETLSKHQNPLRVEGHTDNRPINTRAFPSNWELSAARAASVVHRFQDRGVDPSRLSVIGFGEHRPAQPNDTPVGRNANRRVVIVILAGEGAPAPSDTAGQAGEASQANQPAALPPLAAGNSASGEVNAAGKDLPPASTPAPAPADSAVGTEPAPDPLATTGGGNPTRE